MDFPQPTTLTTKRDNRLMMYGVIIAFFFIPIAGFLFVSGLPTGLPRLFASRLVTWADIGVLYFYAKKVERQKFLLWTENRYDALFYIKWLFILFLLVICCGIIARLQTLFGYHDDVRMLQKMMALVNSNKFGLVFTLITAGVTEELIMRGYILPRLELIFKNPHLALVITSLLFAALHYGYHNIGELIFTFCFAIVFGSHYQIYKNISVLIVMHILVDLMAVSVYHR